jgi:hypothetical protein
MGLDPPGGDVLARLQMSRRDVVRRLIAGSAFAVPVVASFDMASLMTSTADAQSVYAGDWVTSLDPTHGPEAGGNQVLLQFRTTLPGTLSEVDFGATPATNLSLAADGDSATVTAPAGTGTVVVTVTVNDSGALLDLQSMPADMYTYDPPSSPPPPPSPPPSHPPPPPPPPPAPPPPPVVVATSLKAAPLLSTLFLPTVVLTRKDTGAPLAGATISFSVAGRSLGTAVTGTKGKAVFGKQVLSTGGYDAVFAGTTTLSRSTAHGGLLF